MKEVKKIVIRLDKENDIVINSTLEQAPELIFKTLLSIGLTPVNAKKFTNRLIFNLKHGIKLETVHKSDLEGV